MFCELSKEKRKQHIQNVYYIRNVYYIHRKHDHNLYVARSKHHRE